MFTHDCENCKVLGSENGNDWYVCIRESGTELIRRFGDDGPEYSSLPVYIAKQIPAFEAGVSLFLAWQLKPALVQEITLISAPVKVRKPRAPRAEKAPPVKGECGYVDPAWEADIIGFGWCERAARDILAVRSFRSDFRSDMRAKIAEWLDTPAADRKFRSPLSPRQWECIQPFDPRSRYTMGRY